MPGDYETALAAARQMLTDAQFAAMLGPGDRLVTACPGAGKTRAVSARAAVLASQGLRVALTSYTNVGAREMEEALERYFALRLGGEHFVGTLHGLILRYVFRPFGHTVMGCDREPGLRTSTSPEMVHVDDFEFSLDGFHFRPSGELYFKGDRPSGCRLTNSDISILGQEESLRLKVSEACQGVVSAEDALYWSLEVLRREAPIRDAIAERFDEIIVDEAQDTSAVQIACLREVRGAGLRSLLLVGDFDQSIYSFQGASPEACRSLAQDCGLEGVRLAENHRSSQLICNVAATLRPGGEPDAAVGPNRDFSVPPRYYLYDSERLPSLPAEFAERMREQGGVLAESAVIARTKGVVSVLSGGPNMQLSARSQVLDLLRAVGDRDGFLRLTEVENVERLLAAVAGDGEEVLDPLRASDLRAAAMRVIEGLPDAEGTLAAWLDGAVEVVTGVAAEFGTTNAGPVRGLLGVPDRYLGMDVRHAVPAGRADGLRIETVHGVKGLSLDGVLLVASPVETYRGFEVDGWAGVWDVTRRGGTVPPADAEEARVLYVALTRARRFCEIAVPASADPASLRVLEAAGLQRA